MHEHSHDLPLKRRIFRAILRQPMSRKIMQGIGGGMLRHMPGHITCREFEAFLSDYVEGRLSDEQLKLFNRHMSVCPFCRTSLASYVLATKMGQAVCAEEEMDETFEQAPQELIDAIIDITRDKN